MNTHLKAIPRVGTLTTGGLTRSDSENLCRHANRALDTQILLVSTVDKVSADLLQALHITARQGNANALLLLCAGLERLLDGGHG